MTVNKKLRYGGLSVAFTAVTVAIVVLLNVLINTLLSRFDVKLDLTENKLFSIEQATTDFLRKLDSEVDIMFASTESDFTSVGEQNQVNEIAKKFAEANGKISLKYTDLLTNPSFADEYGGNVTTTSIVVKSKKTERYKVLSQSDYIDVKYYNSYGESISETDAQYYSLMGMQYYADVSSSAEQAIVSAILQVTAEDVIRVAFANGFGEGSTLSYSDFSQFLEQNTYTVETVDLNLVSEIDPDIDFVIIFFPTSDYSAEAIGKVAAWIDNKGAYGKNLLYIPSLMTIDTPILDAFLEEWGLSVEKGNVAQSNSSYASSDPYVQYLQVPDGNYSENLAGKKFLGEYFRAVTRVFTERNAYATIPVMTTYDGAVLVPYEVPEGWAPNEEDKAELIVAAESSKLRSDGTGDYKSRVFVFGNPYNFMAETLNATQFANANLYINIFNTLSGRDSGVIIKSKPYMMTTFQITADESSAIAIAFCIVLPLLIIGTGIVVFIRRRYK